MPQHDVIQLAGPIEFNQSSAFAAKITQPVGALVSTFDVLSQFLLVPQSARQHLAFDLINQFLDTFSGTRGIPRVGIGIQNVHAFVNVTCQNLSPGIHDPWSLQSRGGGKVK